MIAAGHHAGLSLSGIPREKQPMDPQTNLSTTDRPCPLAFVIMPAFVGGLIWVCVLLAHLAH
jgi:hypothetical protein